MLEGLLREADAICVREFGVKPERGGVTLYTRKEWDRFLATHSDPAEDGFQTLGLYFAKDHSSHVLKDHPTWIATLYHERYGHGLYHQHSLLGGIVPGVRWKSLGFSHGDKNDIEGFAVWTERFLCLRTGHESIWTRAYEGKPQQWYKEGFHALEQAERALSTKGMFAQMGMPKHWSVEDAASVVSRALPSELAVALPLQDPYAPVEAVAVRRNGVLHDGTWLRVRELTEDEFVRMVKEKDPALAGTLLQGHYLSGDAHAYERARAHLRHAAGIPSLPRAQKTSPLGISREGFKPT